MLLYLLRNNLIPGGINPLTHWSKRRDLWIQQFDLNYIRKLNIWDYRDLAPNNVDRLRLQTLYLQDIYLDSVKEVIIDEEDEAIVKENDLSVFYWFLPFKFATVWRCANLNPTTVISYFYRNRPWRVKEIYFKYSSTWAKEGHLVRIPRGLQILDCPTYALLSVPDMSELCQTELLYMRDLLKTRERKTIHDNFVEISNYDVNVPIGEKSN